MRILEEFWYGNIEPTEYDTYTKESRILLPHWMRRRRMD